MSDLLNQASLVMVPSGYKEDTVYSVVPTDGSGDLSFTRASNGTRINSAGLVEVCPWNLCTYSEDQTQWTSQNETTVTANSTTAPNGTTTADTVTPSTVNDDHYRGIILGQQVGALTAFIYVKPNGYNFFDWGIWNSSQYIVRATFDLVNLTYTFTNAGTATIESVGNGWLKCGISGTNASLTTMSLYYRSRPTGGTGAFTGNGTSGAFIWGAQLNIGSTAKPYFPTTDRLNVPRLTYQNGGGGCPSLLLEKQSTNLVVQSQALTISIVNVGYTATDNNTTSPDGTQNASRILEDTGTLHLIQKQYSVSSTTDYYTASFFVKSISRAKGKIEYGLDGAPYNAISANFDLTAQTISSPSASGSGAVAGSSKIENFGNGWFRVSISGILGVSGTHYTRLLGLNDSGSDTYTGDPSKGFYAWGFQGEASSYPTSYIPTTSSSATRVADACFKTGISSLIGQTSGALFVEFNSSFFESYTQRIFTLSDGTISNVIGFQLTGANELVFYVENGGTNQVVINKASPAITLGSNVKIAAAYANNDFVFYVNGTQIGTDTSGSVPATSQLRFSEANASAFYLGLIKQAILFPTRLTNAELASLTTI